MGMFIAVIVLRVSRAFNMCSFFAYKLYFNKAVKKWKNIEFGKLSWKFYLLLIKLIGGRSLYELQLTC